MICSIIFREKYCITFSGFQERKEPPLHVLMCRLHIKGCLRGWQLCLFSAHIMPETFHVFISNFNETMQGGWKFFILLMMKLKFRMLSPGYTAVYRDGDFSLIVWIYLPGHLPHITDLSAGAHPALPGFLPHPLPLCIMFTDSISWTCLPSSVSLVLWNRTLVKQPAASITRICFMPKLLYPDLELLRQGLCCRHLSIRSSYGV